MPLCRCLQCSANVLLRLAEHTLRTDLDHCRICDRSVNAERTTDLSVTRHYDVSCEDPHNTAVTVAAHTTGWYHLFSLCPPSPPPRTMPVMLACCRSAVVRQVQEYYAEFCAVNEDFFSANCPDSLQLSLPRPPTTAKTLLARNREAVLSVLLALKKKPSTIRYAVGGTFSKEN